MYVWQAKETSHTQSHVADVRGPESVYDIDEETRMGPEMTNDGVTPPVSVMNTCLKKQEGRERLFISKYTVHGCLNVNCYEQFNLI